jgi:amino acid transporter
VTCFNGGSTNIVCRLALPFSKWLYRMNAYTKTPVNSVWYDAGLAIALGLLAFAGTQAINAVFAISVTALYVAYAIPIAARFLGDNDFKPGPFNLGVFVSSFSAKPLECLNGFHRVYRLA